MTTCNPILYFCSIVSHMGGCCSYGRVLLFYDFVPTYKKKISFSTITWKKKKVWGEERGLGRRGLPCILHATVIMPGSKNRDFIFPLRKTLFKKALYKVTLLLNKNHYRKIILIITTFISIKTASTHLQM